MSLCGICSDLFDGVERIATTPCGHVYHSKCLLKWLDVSKTCPECRKNVQKPNVVELYFNVNNSEPINPLSLCNEVENLKSLLQERRSEASDLFNKNTELRKMVVEHESTIASFQQVNMNLERKNLKTMHETYILQTSLETTKVENGELRKKLQSLEDVKTVVAGAQEDAEEILRQATDDAALTADFTTSRKLATFCSIFKRELKRAIEEKNDVRKEVTMLKKELGLTSYKLKRSEATVHDLMKQIEKLESAEPSIVSFSSPDHENSIPSELSTSHSSPKTKSSPSKNFELSPIHVEFENKKRKMKVVILDRIQKKVSKAQDQNVSRILFSPLPKRPDETDSVSRTGYDGLGGHHTVIIGSKDIPKAGRSQSSLWSQRKKKFRKL